MDAELGRDANLEVPNDATRWQYSLRGLFVLTTIISICTGLAVHFASFIFALIVLGVIQTSVLLFADWLIRPANRLALGAINATSWAVFGIALLAIGYRETTECSTTYDGVDFIAAIGFVVAGGCCYLKAVRQWRNLKTHRRENL